MITAPSRAWRRPLLAAVVAAALLLGLPHGPEAEAAPSPSLRLIAANETVTLRRLGSRVPLDLGVLVGAVGGDFQLRVRRVTYASPVGVAQVDSASGATVREVPADLLDGWSGLKDFLRIVVTDAGGEVVARKRLPFCPNSYQRQRVSDEGAINSAYPYSCGSDFPFTKGMIWGIDADWAVAAFGGDEWEAPRVRLDPGRYTITVRIAPIYADLFDIPAADTRVTLRARVRQGGGDGMGEGRAAATASSAARAGATAADWLGPSQAQVPVVTDPPAESLPDLVALPAFNIYPERRRGRDLLTFAANEWNAGPGRLVVEGFRRTGSDVMDAYQYFYDQQGRVVGKSPAGKMAYHDARGHNHWHFLQFASYSLLDADTRHIVRSRKQAFCIVPTDAVDLTVRGAELNGFGIGLGSACGGRGSIWVREVLPAGWGDTYYQSVAGQAFDITDLPNGVYHLQVAVDPLGKFAQRRTSNDVAIRKVRLKGRPGARQVVVSPWHGISDGPTLIGEGR